MGARKEHRDAAAMAREFSERIRAINNDNQSRASFWRDLMSEGHVLTFRHEPTRGRFSIGPYQTAKPGIARYALLWDGATLAPKHGLAAGVRDWFAAGPWDIALRAVEYAGRQRPVMIDLERQ